MIHEETYGIPALGFRNASSNLEAWLKDPRFKTFPNEGDAHVFMFSMRRWLEHHGLNPEMVTHVGISRRIATHLRSLGFKPSIERSGVNVYRAWWKTKDEQQLQR